jgi:transposase
VTEQVGRWGRTVNEVAVELGCDWHTVNDAVIAYGTVLVDDPARIGEPTALGLDETLFCRQGPWRRQCWSTSIVDVANSRLLDVVAGRGAAEPCRWLAPRGEAWCERIAWGTLDLSGPYRSVFDTMLPDATQIADPFHLVKLAKTKLDKVRRRVQNECHEKEASLGDSVLVSPNHRHQGRLDNHVARWTGFFEALFGRPCGRPGRLHGGGLPGGT